MADTFIGLINVVAFTGTPVTFHCNEAYEGNKPHTHMSPESAARCSQVRLRALLPNTKTPRSQPTLIVEASTSVARQDDSGAWFRWAVEQGIVNH